MSDRELLLLAAKAAGIKVHDSCDTFLWILVPSNIEADREQIIYWAPLTDDADALRLAVKLRMQVHVEDYGGSARVGANGRWVGCEAHCFDGIASATRHAIVRAAAEIGKQMGK